ncbi:unnamed protein product [Aureobasidium uvarum]|uniref:Uncharacterized protein n=1 Tax=Aureobasidium uvarum TaxID=2773716 RepID=A0A9N8KHM8_9PEZI|nr:unnamed protein product [Aureobasidium uvarum]
MGGRAFPDLCVPRMNHQTYNQVKHAALKALSQRFASVTAIPEAPGKLDYGDVDLVVELPSSMPLPSQQVILDLGAEHVKINHPVYSFAVPLENTRDTVQAFAQVDVQVCPPGDFAWTTFVNGYGDLGSILGTFNYGYGFTSKNDGFFVRIEEQEAQNRAASQVFLSKDPDLVMDFLGLDKYRFHQGFESERQLFDWAVNSRLFNRRLVEKRRDNSDNRSRMEKRSMFRNFVSQYLPSLPDVGTDATGTRAAYTNAALVFFDTQDEFNTRRLKIINENKEDHAWDIIKTTVLQPLAKLEEKRLNEVVRALKRFVAFKGGEPVMCSEPEMDAEDQARFARYITAADEVAPNLREWILNNWKEVRSQERQRAKGSRRLEGQQG